MNFVESHTQDWIGQLNNQCFYCYIQTMHYPIPSLRDTMPLFLYTLKVSMRWLETLTDGVTSVIQLDKSFLFTTIDPLIK